MDAQKIPDNKNKPQQKENSKKYHYTWFQILVQRAMIIKIAQYEHKCSTEISGVELRHQIQLQLLIWLFFFYKDDKIYIKKKQCLQQMVPEKLSFSMQKN